MNPSDFIVRKPRFLRAPILAFVFLVGSFSPVWACTVFTDRFDEESGDDQFIYCFDVTTSVGPNGSISPESVTLVPTGNVLNFLLNPESGYKVDQVTGCEGEIENETSFVTGPITANCEVSATFTNLGECSLWDQNCPSPQGCYLVSGDGTTSCVTSGGIEAGESCSFVNDCLPGLICAGAPGSSTCRPLCNTNGSVPCESGDCIPIGISNVGACF